MPPQTAILGWGSLLWEGGAEFDRWHAEWSCDGPSLPIEFSRVSTSRLGALTLVIDHEHGSPITVAWCLSKRKDPDDAVADLRCREACLLKNIARLDLPFSPSGSLDRKEVTAVAEWATNRHLDVVVWTALENNFEEKVRKPYSVAEAVAYLKSLPRPAKVRAAEYVWRAPAFVQTNLRKALETEPWFSEGGAG